MGEELEKRTDGRLNVEIYPSMQLGGEKEDDRAGAGRCARHGAHQRRSDGALGPGLNVFNLPYLFRDAAHMEAVIDGPISDELLQKVTDHPTAGLVGLCWIDAGTAACTTASGQCVRWRVSAA